jgi:hypothetical protein
MIYLLYKKGDKKMIVYKQWTRYNTKGTFYKATDYDGWFLLGILPLYIRRLQVR